MTQPPWFLPFRGLSATIPSIVGARKILRVFLFCIIQLLCFCFCSSAYAGDDWYIALRGGVSSPDRFIDFFKLQARFEAENIVVLDVGRRLLRWKDLSLAVEGQLGHHWGVQKYQEANVAVIGRVYIFPECLPVLTSLAIGSGLSYTSTIPIIETDEQKNKNYGAVETSRLLHYLMAEAAFGVTRKANVETFVRIHHRSGIFGIINDITHGGSNFLTGGFRVYF